MSTLLILILFNSKMQMVFEKYYMNVCFDSVFQIYCAVSKKYSTITIYQALSEYHKAKEIVRQLILDKF